MYLKSSKKKLYTDNRIGEQNVKVQRLCSLIKLSKKLEDFLSLSSNRGMKFQCIIGSIFSRYFSMPRPLLWFGALLFSHSICIINSMEVSVAQKT